jgi:DNA-binding transcriptional regulator YhcF (GntR family)
MNAKMESPYLLRNICFHEHSITPKYQQLANCIIESIENGKLQVGDVLPSISELCVHFDICGTTAEKGYKKLKSLGIVGAVPGKGYFIQRIETEKLAKVFLMFNKLSLHKKIIYDSFIKTLGSNVSVDFYVYNNDFSMFKKLLNNVGSDYDYYVIIPHFIEGEEQAAKIIDELDKAKLILIDKMIPSVKGDYSAIYEDFKDNIYQALTEALDVLKKYHTIKIIFPDNSYYPYEIVEGFISFCQQYAFNYAVVNNIKNEKLCMGEVYINLIENDLVTLIEKIKEEKLKVGKEIGVVSL